MQAREKELRRKKGDNGGTSAEHSVEERRTDGERQREALRDSVRKSAIELGLWRPRRAVKVGAEMQELEAVFLLGSAVSASIFQRDG